MLGKLDWSAIPFGQPIPLIAGAVVLVGILAVLIWVVVKGHLPYLWHEWITSVDHKRIGVMYILLASVMLLRGGSDAIMMRIQQAIAYQSQGYLPPEHYNQIFSAHGTIMIFFTAMPFVIGLMNLVVPLQLGVRDVAFPTLNSVGFWLTATGALLVNISLVVGEFAHTGWLAFPPLSELSYSPGVGVDYYAWSLQISGVGTLVAGIGHQLRSGPGRNVLGRDQVEQPGIVEAIGWPALLDALLHQLLVAVLVQHSAGLGGGRHPIRKGERRDHVDVEHHVGKAVAGEMRRQALELALIVGAQVQPRHHAVHGVDHAAELRDEEHVHHARRGQLEIQLRTRGHRQRIDGGDTLVGIDEEPFPVERDGLDPHRAAGARHRCGGIELMRADPGDAAEQEDGERRDRPHHHLDTPGIDEVRLKLRFRIGGAKPEGEGQDRDDGRHHDRKHDENGIDQDGAVGRSYRPLRIEQIHRQATGGREAPGKSVTRKTPGNKRSCVKTVPRRACSIAGRAAARHAIPCDVNDMNACQPAFSPRQLIAIVGKK